jgi:hypothetical protein
VEELGLPELTNEQIEEVCTAAEDAAKRYVFSKIKPKMIESLNISVEAEGERPLNLTVEIDIAPSSILKEPDLKALANEASHEAIRASENYLRKLK